MVMTTGENEQGLRKILDMTRMISLVLLALHFYYYCYGAFEAWQWTAPLGDRLLHNLQRTGLFAYDSKSKLLALGFLLISLLGARGRKDRKLHYKGASAYILLGLGLYFGSVYSLQLHFSITKLAIVYMASTTLGYLFVLTGGGLLSRIIQHKLSSDVFNKMNETFPQEERLLTNEFSINLPAHYELKGKVRKSWINIVNPFRGLLVMGSPGSGKSYFVIRQVIRQHLQKGFSMLVYDFKWDDLTRYTYHHFLQYQD
jgi:hypothetical protein